MTTVNTHPRLWLSEKECYRCQVQLGHGTHRSKKLHCRRCFHAICSQCSLSTPHSAQVLCLSCKDSRDTAETASLDLMPSQSPLIEPSFDCGSSISDSFEDVQVLSSVLHSAKQLVLAMSTHSRGEQDQLSEQIQRLSQQLRNRHSEIEMLRDQEKWYATQLVAREAEIKELGYDVAVLSSRNYDLESQLKGLNRHHKSLVSTPHPRASCCSCSLS